ncbi:hypothetical protein PIB30_009012 [Stylosanthes scabra]|uniref:Uncharacterized protein n=1 Tax=Stylosanthes scabra TaxID=79078 RepID=A0ABU6T754_9FABA|nr:hypothetical protein [Stylosanthes scabra]
MQQKEVSIFLFVDHRRWRAHDGRSGWALLLEALPSRYQSLERCHRGETKFENTEYETRVVLPKKQKQRFIFDRVFVVVDLSRTERKLDGLSLKENEPPQGVGVNPYPKILGIHNSGGSGSYDRTRINPTVTR